MEQTKLENKPQTALEQAGLCETLIQMSPRIDEFCLREVKYTPEQCKKCPRDPDSINFCNTRDLKLLVNKNNQLLQKLLEK